MAPPAAHVGAEASLVLVAGTATEATVEIALPGGPVCRETVRVEPGAERAIAFKAPSAGLVRATVTAGTRRAPKPIALAASPRRERERERGVW